MSRFSDDDFIDMLTRQWNSFDRAYNEQRDIVSEETRRDSNGDTYIIRTIRSRDGRREWEETWLNGDLINRNELRMNPYNHNRGYEEAINETLRYIMQQELRKMSTEKEELKKPKDYKEIKSERRTIFVINKEEE